MSVQHRRFPGPRALAGSGLAALPLFVLALNLSLPAPAGAQQVVEFPDATLEATVRFYLNKHSGDDITDQDLLGLTTVSVTFRDVSDIAPLAGLTA